MLTSIDNGTWRELRLRLFRFVRSRVHHDHDAEDIVHDALVRGLTKLDDIRDVESLTPWFFQITMNAIRDHYRRQRPEFATELDENIAAEPTPADLRDVSECVASMVHLLEEPYRSAIRRSELDGVPMRVIADELNISVSGVKSRVQRGRVKLKELVSSCCQLELDASGRPLLHDDHECTTPGCSCGRSRVQ